MVLCSFEYCHIKKANATTLWNANALHHLVMLAESLLPFLVILLVHRRIAVPLMRGQCKAFVQKESKFSSKALQLRHANDKFLFGVSAVNPRCTTRHLVDGMLRKIFGTLLTDPSLDHFVSKMGLSRAEYFYLKTRFA
jgi:hypothetical protein